MSKTADILTRLRKRGLSQADIVRKTGIPQPRVSRWERGEVPAGADDALRLHALEAELAAADGVHVPQAQPGVSAAS